MKRLFIVALGILFLSSFAKADYDIKGDVEWQAIITPGDAIITAKAKEGILGCKLTGKEELSGECKVFMEHFKTGKILRDKHLHWNYLHSSEYKWSNLKIKGFKPQEGKQPFKGELTLLKETHPIQGTIDLKKTEFGYKGQAKFGVSLDTFKSIGKPSFLGETLKDVINVTVELEATKK